MTEREEIDALKKQLGDLERASAQREVEFLNLLLDIGDIRKSVQGNKESIARVSTFFGSRSVEFRDRITALETRFFKTIDDFQDIEQIIGKSDGAGPHA